MNNDEKIDARLYIDADPDYALGADNPRRNHILATYWAKLPSDPQDRERRAYWLRTQHWETGRYMNYKIIVFVKPEVKLIAFPAEAEAFGMGLKWFTPKPYLEFNWKGSQKFIHSGDNDDFIPTPEWRRQWFELWKFKDAHRGKTPEEWEKQEERKRKRYGK